MVSLIEEKLLVKLQFKKFIESTGSQHLSSSVQTRGKADPKSPMCSPSAG